MHIVETELTMPFYAQLPKHFWVDAFMNVVYLINWLPSSILKMETPFFKLHGTYLDYNSLNGFLDVGIFLVYVTIPRTSSHQNPTLAYSLVTVLCTKAI
jgi:hypothetical protein